MMKRLKLLLLSLSITIGFQYFLKAQVKLPKAFKESLEQMDLSIAIPIEQSFKNKRIKKNDFFNPDFVIRSKRNKIEIQYALLPQSIYSDLIPNVYATTTISNIASNEGARANIIVHDIKEESLLNIFKADWGSVAYFQPKYSISKYNYGKLLSLYRDGKGMIYVLFLFDDEDMEEVELRYLAASFGI